MASANPLLSAAQHSAAFHRNNLGFRARFGFDPFQNGDDVLQDLVRRIVPELVHEVLRVGTDDRNRFQILLQRQKVSFILQQHDSFAAGAQSEVLIGLRVHRADGAIHIDVGILEETQAKLQLQNPAHRAIHQRHGHASLFHVLDQRAHVGGLVGDVQIDAGLQGQRARFLLGGDNVLVNQCPEAAAFALHDSLEAHLLPQDIVHPLLGSVRGHVLDLRVSGHHTQTTGFGDSRAPGKQEVLAQRALR